MRTSFSHSFLTRRRLLPLSLALAVLALAWYAAASGAAPGAAWLAAAFWLALAAAVLATAAWRRRERTRVARMAAFCREAAGGGNPSAKAPALRRRDPLGALEEGIHDLARTLTGRLRDMTAEREKLQSILSCMMDGVIVLDTNGKVMLVNQMAQTLFRLPPDASLLGMSTVEVSRHPAMQALIGEVVKSGRRDPLHRELDLGDDRWFAVNAARLEDAGQDLLGYVLVFHEVTALKRLERIRADFVANVSHEMRTPLTAIQGYAETLLEDPPADRQTERQFLNIVARHSGRLGRLIDDLLALSDLEMGNVSVRRQRVGAGPLLDRVLDLFSDQTDRKRIGLRARVAPDTPDLLGDEDRLQQLLINLVDNALKYTPEGGQVLVSADAEPGSGGPERVVLTVADTGCGIPDKDLPRLTERFYRVDKARSRELGGTGLGLAIVKHIVQAHGGELGIDSEPGKGTRVSIRLACAAAEPPALQDAPAESEVA